MEDVVDVEEVLTGVIDGVEVGNDTVVEDVLLVDETVPVEDVLLVKDVLFVKDTLPVDEILPVDELPLNDELLGVDDMLLAAEELPNNEIPPADDDEIKVGILAVEETVWLLEIVLLPVDDENEEVLAVDEVPDVDDDTGVVLRILVVEEIPVLLEVVGLSTLPVPELVEDIDAAVEEETEGLTVLLTLEDWDCVDGPLALDTLDPEAPPTSSAESVSEAYAVLTTAECK